MKPSNFRSHPWASFFRNSESETIARNIMTILSRIANEWRELSWAEYKAERLKDGNFSEMEKGYFDDVLPYCKSPQDAYVFCKDWHINS